MIPTSHHTTPRLGPAMLQLPLPPEPRGPEAILSTTQQTHEEPSQDIELVVHDALKEAALVARQVAPHTRGSSLICWAIFLVPSWTLENFGARNFGEELKNHKKCDQKYVISTVIQVKVSSNWGTDSKPMVVQLVVDGCQ